MGLPAARAGRPTKLSTGLRRWARHTSGNVDITSTVHHIAAAGVRVLKFWMSDPTVVHQNLVIGTGGIEPGRLGPPESLRPH